MTNAGITGSGVLFIYSGVLKIAQTDDELAAILSHEVASVVAGHPFERMRAHALGRRLLLPFMPFGLLGHYISPILDVGIPLTFLWALVVSSLFRKQVSEANDIGHLLLADTGFDPSAFTTFHKNVNAAEEHQRSEFKKSHKDVEEPAWYTHYVKAQPDVSEPPICMLIRPCTDMKIT